MPQCDFFITEKDEIRIVDWVLSRGGWLVPSLDYDAPHYREVKSTQGYLELRSKTNLFFMLHSSFYACPLALKGYSGGPKLGRYFLVQRVGGPALSWFVPRIYQRDDVRFRPAGMVAYYPTYQKTVESESEEVPKEIRVFYLDLLNVLKQEATATDIHLRTYWVTLEAQDEFREGSIQPGLEIDT